MTFRRSSSMAILLVIYVVFLFFSTTFSFELTTVLGVSTVILIFEVYLFNTIFQYKDGIIMGRTLFFRTSEFHINEVKLIEAVRVNRLGHIYIYVKSPIKEDYYVVVLLNGTRIKIDRYYTYKGTTVGRFLSKQCGKPLVDKIKLKILDDGA